MVKRYVWLNMAERKKKSTLSMAKYSTHERNDQKQGTATRDDVTG